MADDLFQTIIAAYKKLRVTMSQQADDSVNSNAGAVMDSIDHAIEVVGGSSPDSVIAKTKPALLTLITTYEQALRSRDGSHARLVRQAFDFLVWITDAQMRAALDAVHIAVRDEPPTTYDAVRESTGPLASEATWLTLVQRSWPVDGIARTPETSEEAQLVCAMCLFVQHGIIQEALPPDAHRMGVLLAAERLASARPFVDRDSTVLPISVCVKAWFQLLRLSKFNASFARCGARLRPSHDATLAGTASRVGFGAFSIAIRMDISQWLIQPYLRAVFGNERSDRFVKTLSNVGVIAESKGMAGGGNSTTVLAIGVSLAIALASAIAAT